MPTSYAERWGAGAFLDLNPEVPLARLARTKRPFPYPDIRQSPPFLTGNPLARSAVIDAGIHAVLALPMLKEGQVVCAIVIFAKERDHSLNSKSTAGELCVTGGHRHRERANAGRIASTHQRPSPRHWSSRPPTSEVLRVIGVHRATSGRSSRRCSRKLWSLRSSFGDAYRWDGKALNLLATLNTPSALPTREGDHHLLPVRKMRWSNRHN